MCRQSTKYPANAPAKQPAVSERTDGQTDRRRRDSKRGTNAPLPGNDDSVRVNKTCTQMFIQLSSCSVGDDWCPFVDLSACSTHMDVRIDRSEKICSNESIEGWTRSKGSCFKLIPCLLITRKSVSRSKHIQSADDRLARER